MNIKITKLCNLSAIASFVIISLVYSLASVESNQAHADPAPQASLNTPAEDWQNTTLLIDIAHGLCKYDKTYANYRQCKEGDPYVIAGLDLGNHITCHSKTLPNLPPLQAKVVDRIMPDKRTQVLAWQTYGACGNVKDTRYFRQIIQLSDNLNLPTVLESGGNHVMNKADFINELRRGNRGLKEQHIHLHCLLPKTQKPSHPVLSNIEICYKGQNFRNCQKHLSSYNHTARNTSHLSRQSCGNTFIISGL